MAPRIACHPTPSIRPRMKRPDPDKIGSIDAILEQYTGREEELFQKLNAKYNATQPSTVTEDQAGESEHRQRLHAFFSKHNPDKLGSIDIILEQYAGREEELFEKLDTKYS
eukprot:gene56762-biopygen95098